MAKMPKQVMELFNDPASIKFLATVDSEGKPNAVVIASMVAIDNRTLAFADLIPIHLMT